MDGCPAGGEVVELGEFLFRGGQADLESFGFAVPALAFSLGDAGQQVAADVFQPWALGRVNAEERAPEVPLTELTDAQIGYRHSSTDCGRRASSALPESWSSLRVAA
jgi:hypothetical protein